MLVPHRAVQTVSSGAWGRVYLGLLPTPPGETLCHGMGLTSVLDSGRQGHRNTALCWAGVCPFLTPQSSLPRGPEGKPYQAGRGSREKEKEGASAGPGSGEPLLVGMVILKVKEIPPTLDRLLNLTSPPPCRGVPVRVQ